MTNPRDLTVVLTLKNRSSFTYRWMRWMRDQEFPYKILIADGGTDKAIERHLEDRSHYPNLDYEYIKYPTDANVAMFVNKLADAASRVTTTYVMSADNDDLILLEPLERNLRLIRDRPDIHTLGPSQYRFRIHKDSKSRDDLVSAQDARVTLVRLSHVRNPSLEESDPLTRLLSVVEKFYSAFIYYGIHRSDDYKRICGGLQKLETQRFTFFEWYTLYSYAIAGKIVLDSTDPFLLRQEDTSQAASATYSWENHASIFLLPDWSAQLYGMIGDLYQWCTEASGGLDRAAFEERFRDAFRKHMLSFMEFRGLADRFRRFPNLYAFGRKLFALYRGNAHPVVSRREVRANQPLRRVLQFLRDYDGARQSETENARHSPHAVR